MSVSRDYFISEKNFAESMKNIVEPFLEERCEDSFFEALDGKKIHYVYYKADEARGNMVVCHGFTESGEKFREMCYYFVRMGLNVFAVDNRGHGLSHRHTDNKDIVHIKKFEQYVTDLQSLVKKVVRPNAGELPLYLYSHSMGGGISVQHMQKYPGVFEKVILSAPMIKAKTAGIPAGIAKAVSRLFIVFGKEKNKVVGYKPFNPERTYEDSHDTSEARFNYYHEKRKASSHLQTSAPSYRWVNEAVEVGRLNLIPERNARITARVLLCQPETDSAVVSEKEDAFIKQIKNGRLVKFTGCRHEIYNSVDDTVKEYLDEIEKFLFE